MAHLIEVSHMRNKHQLFEDRIEAGRFLAGLMENFEEAPDTMVLAIPSGGVPVGLELSGLLKLPMDLIITRKLQIPGTTEAGFGALSLGGKAFFNIDMIHRLRLNEEEIEAELAVVRRELERRNRVFRNDRSVPDLTGQTVILTDDGLASGYTMMAAIDMVRHQGAKTIVVAVPTSPRSSLERLDTEADEIICANVQDIGPFAVAAAYKSWRDIDTEEVVTLLRDNGLLS